MSKYTKEQLETKRASARDLYIKGFDVDTIADTLSVSAVTVGRWAKQLDFDEARRASSVALSEIRRTIVDSFIALKKGEQPTISPDAAAKFAKAFEKLSDTKKCLPYMFEAYDLLSEELMHRTQEAVSTKDKQHWLDLLKEIRPVTQDILSRLTKEQLNNN